MTRTCLLLLIIVGFAALAAAQLDTVLKFKPMQQQQSSADQILNILRKSEPLARYQTSKFFDKWKINRRNIITSFKWTDCGNSSSIIVFKDAKVSPDPLRFPGDLSVSANVQIKKDIAEHLSAKVELWKIIGIFKIRIPCVENVGSCDYDVCSFLGQIGQCPNVLIKNNIPCHCPFKKADYNLPTTKFVVKTDPVPPGDYKAKVVLYDEGTFAGCLDISASFAA